MFGVASTIAMCFDLHFLWWSLNASPSEMKDILGAGYALILITNTICELMRFGLEATLLVLLLWMVTTVNDAAGIIPSVLADARWGAPGGSADDCPGGGPGFFLLGRCHDS